MIGSLRGLLLDRSVDGEVLIEVAGVGYRVTVTAATMTQLPETGSEAFIHVHHHIREDDQQLFGFVSLDDRRCFEVLISAHGVGPALALAVLSTHPPDRLRFAVATDDVDALCLVPGVGKKTAARLLLELKSKLEVPEGSPEQVAAPPAGSEVVNAKADVREALSGMGFTSEEIRIVLIDLTDTGDAAAMLRDALRALAAS